MKAGKAVAGVKGAAAEGRMLQIPLGKTEKIRLTVAFAESYVLIVKSLLLILRAEKAHGVYAANAKGISCVSF